MQSVSVNQFRDQLKQYADTAVVDHSPLMVTRRNGGDFIVVSATDWFAEQETLYVLQSQGIMAQIADSMKTFQSENGKTMTQEQQDEIDRF
jgi:antitoxin YefM